MKQLNEFFPAQPQAGRCDVCVCVRTTSLAHRWISYLSSLFISSTGFLLQSNRRTETKAKHEIGGIYIGDHVVVV